MEWLTPGYLTTQLLKFSFFSPVHQTYSRIVYFQTDLKIFPLIPEVKDHSIVISDCCLVLLRLCFPEKNYSQRTLRLNTRLLADKDIVDFINTHIDFLLLLSSYYFPYSGNVNFAPSLTEPSFQLWHRNGILCVKDLFKDGHFKSFQRLKTDFNIPHSGFFQYLQVHSFVKSQFSLNTPQNTWIDKCLNMDLVGTGQVSVLYDNIHGVASKSLNHIKRRWEDELGITILDFNWQAAISLVHSLSICIRHGLLQLRVLHK